MNNRNVYLTATLVIISLGGGILAWEWHHAHTAGHKHGKIAAHHQTKHS